MRITSIDIFSAASMMGAVYALFGLLAGAFFSLLSMVGMMANQGNGIGPLIFGAGAIVVMPLLYGILGFIGGALGALIYNIAASVAGGIQVSVDGGQRPE